ncbi:MAG TPA: chemotaxis protein CheW [Firmicutes bacterium]|jgi:purine-binding chemotaxis protein CheW|nr:chemotaxis protein CheW [Bacillota bacterium]
MVTDTGKYLTFLLDDEIYGLPIKKAREIIGMLEIIHLPRTQNYIKGVINLRGKIIPIVDLRLRFGMAEKEYSERTCVIVIEIAVHDTQRLMGIAVDTVSEVINIQNKEIEPPPEYDTQIEGNFLTGLGKLKDRVILILDIEKILNREDLVNIKQELKDIK